MLSQLHFHCWRKTLLTVNQLKQQHVPERKLLWWKSRKRSGNFLTLLTNLFPSMRLIFHSYVLLYVWGTQPFFKIPNLVWRMCILLKWNEALLHSRVSLVIVKVPNIIAVHFHNCNTCCKPLWFVRPTRSFCFFVCSRVANPTYYMTNLSEHSATFCFHVCFKQMWTTQPSRGDWVDPNPSKARVWNLYLTNSLRAVSWELVCKPLQHISLFLAQKCGIKTNH